MSGDRTHCALTGYRASAFLPVVRSSIHGIFLASACLAAVSLPASAAEPPALTERRALVLALSRPAYRDLEQSQLSTAESVVTEAGLLPNPTLSLERDRTSIPGGRSTETSLQISQTFDFSGRRALRLGEFRQAGELHIFP